VSGEDPYLYPGSSVLRNKFGFRNQSSLDRIERRLVSQRIAEGAPAGDFDLTHLQAIHHHLFQDVYDWAGEMRSVEIAKGGQRFQIRRFIETGLADIHQRLRAADFLRRLREDAFAKAAGEILGDINYVHPFREGNGRAQLQYLDQLAEQAGHPVDLARLRGDLWVTASRAAHDGDYGRMTEEIRRALI
jgi:cell filamentation protein